LREETIATIKAARLMVASEERHLAFMARTHKEAGKVEGEGMGQGEGDGEGNQPSLDGARPVAELRDAAESPMIGGAGMDLTGRGDVLSCEPGEHRVDNVVKSLREWEGLGLNSAEKDFVTQLQAAIARVGEEEGARKRKREISR